MDKHETPDLSATDFVGGELHNIKLYEVKQKPLCKVKTPIMKQNLMIAQKTKDFLDMIRNKYHVSFSTIVDVLYNNFKIDLKFKDTFFKTDITKSYIDKAKLTPTTIKINQTNEKELKQNYVANEIRKLLSNLCYMFANDMEGTLYDKKQKGNLKSRINNDLAKKKETYWNYNSLYRSLVRARKQYGTEYNDK